MPARPARCRHPAVLGRPPRWQRRRPWAAKGTPSPWAAVPAPPWTSTPVEAARHGPLQPAAAAWPRATRSRLQWRPHGVHRRQAWPAAPTASSVRPTVRRPTAAVPVRWRGPPVLEALPGVVPVWRPGQRAAAALAATAAWARAWRLEAHGPAPSPEPPSAPVPPAAGANQSWRKTAAVPAPTRIRRAWAHAGQANGPCQSRTHLVVPAANASGTAAMPQTPVQAAAQSPAPGEAAAVAAAVLRLFSHVSRAPSRSYFGLPIDRRQQLPCWPCCRSPCRPLRPPQARHSMAEAAWQAWQLQPVATSPCQYVVSR